MEVWVWCDIHGIYIYIPPVIKHGVLENPWFILIYREFPIAMFDYRRVLAGLVLVINSHGNGYNGDINDWLTMSVYIFARFCELLCVHQIRDLLLAGTWPKSRARLLLSILETLLRSLWDVAHPWKFDLGVPYGSIWYHFGKMLSWNELKLVSSTHRLRLKNPMICHCGRNLVKTLCWEFQKHLRMIGIPAAIDLNRLVLRETPKFTGNLGAYHTIHKQKPCLFYIFSSQIWGF